MKPGKCTWRGLLFHAILFEWFIYNGVWVFTCLMRRNYMCTELWVCDHVNVCHLIPNVTVRVCTIITISCHGLGSFWIYCNSFRSLLLWQVHLSVYKNNGAHLHITRENPKLLVHDDTGRFMNTLNGNAAYLPSLIFRGLHLSTCFPPSSGNGEALYQDEDVPGHYLWSLA